MPFDLPLSLSATLPFVGEAELFSARLFGELAATFGLQVTAAANNGRPDPDDPGATPTGTITATLPYQLAYSFPTLDPAGDAVGLESDNAPRWVFVDAEADLSGIDRRAVEYDTGVTVDALTRDIEVSMTGILIGSMQEFA
ncbi:hypothetical protein HUK65_16585 [Rhodobacteraceae bacterium 2376]|uniref:Uncharacterized protein n=1 Tax=Rhabdonatronobacter sediminivivens TaxID=2743469 RepID=A0A7Z0I280_9RHOB|nr:hypothetical protein [Rhabdonatronobacter sediminivivens]NYS26604.1 hypothetical protein [Rhabdonatronobacter sediminivivens]